MNGRTYILLFLCIVLEGTVVRGALRVASVFSDGMVLQRGKPVPVWGTAPPGEQVTVLFAGQKKTAPAGADGRWRVLLDPMEASHSGQSLQVSSLNARLSFADVLIGDVWLCSGQSNMAFPLKHCLKAETLLPVTDEPGLRLLEIPHAVTTEPQDRFTAEWNSANTNTAPSFSAVGYIFGRRIHAETGVPIGLIECALGSTSVECWVSNETLENKLFAPAVKKWREVESAWNDPAVRAKHIHRSVKDPGSIRPSEARTYPSGSYNAMLHPLFPFALKGVVWYQGEANRERGFQYRSLFPAMVAEWRADFEQADLKFYIVQLPEIGKTAAPSGGDSMLAELREAQWITARNDPLMEMAVIIDTDPQGNLHPKNKQLPGERLARIALAKDYGKEIEYSGPLFRELTTEGNRGMLFFDHVSSGLIVGKRPSATGTEVEPVDEPLANFAVAGADRIFFPADAVIEGDCIAVSSRKVSKPVAVRYAWADNPAGCNLYNRSGLPASPFRTDDWPSVTENRIEGKVLVIRP